MNGKTPQEVCIKHHRKISSYYPIHPNTNSESSYDPIFVESETTHGYIDLITLVTLGTSTIILNFKAHKISKESFEKILSAHHKLMGTIDVPRGPVLDLQLAPAARQIVLKLAEDILHASRTGVLNKQVTERIIQEIIAACSVLPPSPVSSIASGSSEKEEKVVSPSTSSVTCKERCPAARKPEDDRDGGDGGDCGGGPGRGSGGSDRRGKGKGRGKQREKDTRDKHTSASSSKAQEAVEFSEAGGLSEHSYKKSTDEDWEFVSKDCQEPDETTEEFGDLEWTWEILDCESEIDDSDLSEESGSGTPSLTAGGLADVGGWLEDLIFHSELKSKVTEPPATPPISIMEEAWTDEAQGNL